MSQVEQRHPIAEPDDGGNEQVDEPDQRTNASKQMTPRRTAAAAIQYELGGFTVSIIILLPVSRRFIERQFDSTIPTGVVVLVTSSHD